MVLRRSCIQCQWGRQHALCMEAPKARLDGAVCNLGSGGGPDSSRGLEQVGLKDPFQPKLA